MRGKVMIRHIAWIVVVVLMHVQVFAQEKKLVVWSHWGTEPVKVNFMNAVAEEFKKLTGVTVEIVWIPKMELLEKLPFALTTTTPDITYLDAGFTQPRIVRALLDLGDLKFTGEIDATWQLAALGEANNKFLPIEGLSNAFYYNKDLFKQAQIVLPPDRGLTGAEFLDIIRKLRAAGITPIGEGSSDRNTKIGLPLMNTIFRYAGPEKVAQLFKGEINFSDPDVAAALTLWKQVVDAQGYDPEKAIQLTLSEGIFEVTDGKAAMSYCGTYFYSKYGSTERDNGQIGVLDLFRVDNGKGNNYYELLWGAGFGINANSPQLEDAKQFLTFLMTPTAAALWVKHVQAPYPVMADQTPSESLYGALVQQRKGQQTSPVNFSYYFFPSKAVQQMWEEETRKFITGEHSVAQFIERMNSRMP